MKLYLLISALFLFSCSAAPKVYLRNGASKIWIENIKNKTVSDDYENIYKFNDKADMNIFVYGYYSKAVKYKLFEAKEDRAFYYTITTFKSHIITVLINLYDINKKNYNLNGYFSFKNKNIYIAVGLILKDNILYMAKDYSADYKERLDLWLKNNGYFYNDRWNPYSGADWDSYPLPTEADINWDNLYIIGEIV